MVIVKVEQIIAELLTFEDGSQKIAFNVPSCNPACGRVRIKDVTSLLHDILICEFIVDSRRQYTTIRGVGGKKAKVALYLVESKSGVYVSMHKDISSKYRDSDARFPSTSRVEVMTHEQLAGLFSEIKVMLDLFLRRGVFC